MVGPTGTAMVLPTLKNNNMEPIMITLIQMAMAFLMAGKLPMV